MKFIKGSKWNKVKKVHQSLKLEQSQIMKIKKKKWLNFKAWMEGFFGLFLDYSFNHVTNLSYNLKIIRQIDLIIQCVSYV